MKVFFACLVFQTQFKRTFYKGLNPSSVVIFNFNFFILIFNGTKIPSLSNTISVLSYKSNFALLLSGVSNAYHSVCVWPTALKLGCVTNFDMLFLVTWFISLVDELKFMLISSRHICIRSVSANAFMKTKVHDALHLD